MPRCVKHGNKRGRLIELDCPVCEAQRTARRLLRRLKATLKRVMKGDTDEV